MKKVIAIIGSAQKKATYQAVQVFEQNLKQFEEIDFKYVFLSDYNLEFCRGCKACFDKGEEYCPLKDDRDELLNELEQSDGIILATPNYAFHVSARMKNFFDRLAYVFHRPRFFGKTCTAIVTQGFFGGKDIVKYLLTSAVNLGFQTTKGSFLSTLDPMTKNQKEKMKHEMKKTAERFYKGLVRQKQPAPSLFRLMLFRMTRTSLKYFEEMGLKDYYYYKEKGWFKSDYYYNTSLGMVKKAAGNIFDFLGRQFAKNIKIIK